MHQERSLPQIERQFRRRGDTNTPLSETKVICIGEIHVAPSNRRRYSQLIQALSKPGDIVLLEGYPAGEEISPIMLQSEPTLRDIKLPNYIKIEGWDDDRLIVEQLEAGGSESLATLFAYFRLFFRRDLDRSQRKEQRANLLQKAKELMETSDTLSQNRSDLLAQTIKTHTDLSENQTIFAIMGRDHLGDLRKTNALEGMNVAFIVPKTSITDILLFLPRSIKYFWDMLH